MVSGSLAMLCCFINLFVVNLYLVNSVIFLFYLSRAAAPVGDKSPVKWGEIPSVFPSRSLGQTLGGLRQTLRGFRQTLGSLTQTLGGSQKALVSLSSDRL